MLTDLQYCTSTPGEGKASGNERVPSLRCCELAVYDVLGYDALYDRVARNPGALARFDPPWAAVAKRAKPRPLRRKS